MNKFQTAKWIWIDFRDEVDSYGEFYAPFRWNGGAAICRLSCDGDYTLYVNGAYAASWQYGNYEHYKVYDEVDITHLLQRGENHLAVLVWHYGENSQRYKRAPAGVLFEVTQGDTVLAASGADTQCRKSRAFASGRAEKITGQMGFSFCYAAPEEDGWKTGEMSGGHHAAVVAKNCRFCRRYGASEFFQITGAMYLTWVLKRWAYLHWILPHLSDRQLRCNGERICKTVMCGAELVTGIFTLHMLQNKV